MDKSKFIELEEKEDDILRRLDIINKEINEIIRVTTGVSSEFKEQLIDRIICTLSITNSTNTWDRD